MTPRPTPEEETPLPDGENQLAGVRRGDERAFEQIFRAHYPALCDFARRYVGDDGTAEELVQDVFTTLWAKRAEWSVTCSIRSYLFGAVRNRALNRRKRDALERDWVHQEAATTEPFPMVPDAEEEMESEGRMRAVDSAIETLPERCRLVMRLRWRNQLSYAEIAEVMGISVKGVENQLSRGLKALRERLLPPRR